MNRLLPFALAAVLLPSCQSMSEGILGLEGRAIIFDDQSLDNVTSDDIDVASYGAQLSLNTPIVDVLASLDMREYGDEDTPELQFGARRRFLELWKVHPFVEANLRYGIDLDTGQVSDGYFGYNFGGGVLVDLTDHMFLTARVLWETADLEYPGGSVSADGVVGMIGVGVHF